MKRIDVFVIDGQNDFCASGNEPSDWPQPAHDPKQLSLAAKGALFVEGADKEAVLVADMFDRLATHTGSKIAKVHASLDSHHKNDGSHNTSWKGRDGKSPPPFTIVSNAMVKAQEFIPRFPIGVFEGKVMQSLEWADKYTAALDKLGRAPLCLWPPHCQIGTWGQCVYHPLMQAYDRWCDKTGGWIDWITKGQWAWTEHYSALRADVPDSTRPETQLNTGVIQDAMEADLIVWCGWAGSHCLRWTALDAVNFFGAGENAFLKKCVFLEDASAAVPNIPNPSKDPNIPDFAQWRLDFLAEVKKRGAAGIANRGQDDRRADQHHQRILNKTRGIKS
jgi:nicotinamidase-related amidase